MQWMPASPVSSGESRLWDFKNAYEGFLHWKNPLTSAVFPECVSVTYSYKLKISSHAT